MSYHYDPNVGQKRQRDPSAPGGYPGAAPARPAYPYQQPHAQPHAYAATPHGYAPQAAHYAAPPAHAQAQAILPVLSQSYQPYGSLRLKILAPPRGERGANSNVPKQKYNAVGFSYNAGSEEKNDGKTPAHAQPPYGQPHYPHAQPGAPAGYYQPPGHAAPYQQPAPHAYPHAPFAAQPAYQQPGYHAPYQQPTASAYPSPYAQPAPPAYPQQPAAYPSVYQQPAVPVPPAYTQPPQPQSPSAVPADALYDPALDIPTSDSGAPDSAPRSVSSPSAAPSPHQASPPAASLNLPPGLQAESSNSLATNNPYLAVSAAASASSEVSALNMIDQAYKNTPLLPPGVGPDHIDDDGSYKHLSRRHPNHPQHNPKYKSRRQLAKEEEERRAKEHIDAMNALLDRIDSVDAELENETVRKKARPSDAALEGDVNKFMSSLK